MAHDDWLVGGGQSPTVGRVLSRVGYPDEDLPGTGNREGDGLLHEPARRIAVLPHHKGLTRTGCHTCWVSGYIQGLVWQNQFDA